MSALSCRAARILEGGIGSAAASVAPDRTATAKRVREFIDFMMRGDGRGLGIDEKVNRGRWV